MERATITKIVKNYDTIPPRVFGFVSIDAGDGTYKGGFITRGLIEGRGLSEDNVGEEYMVALDYANQRGQYPRVIRMQAINGMEAYIEAAQPVEARSYEKGDAYPASEPQPYPQETSELPPFNLAAVEMSVHGIETAVTGVELALTPHQLTKVAPLLKQIRQCADVLKEELDVETNEDE